MFVFSLNKSSLIEIFKSPTADAHLIDLVPFRARTDNVLNLTMRQSLAKSTLLLFNSNFTLEQANLNL